MLALLAAIVLAPLLYIPGYLIAVALLGAAQPLDLLERYYERVLAGALLNGWLALTLAELGVFSAWLHLALIVLVCLGCAAIAWRRGVWGWPRAPLGIISRREMSVGALKRLNASALATHWDTIAFVAVGLLFALLVARPFEVVLGARDAGVYATTGFAIARNGGIIQYDPLLQQIDQDQHAADPQLRAAAEQAETNFLGVQSEQRFIATRMRYAGYLVNQGDLSQGRVTSQFLHLYPAWIALLASLLGLRGGLLATGLLGLLGVWGVGMLGRRLAGSWVGLLGMLFLALNGVQVWFSRYSTSEACAQFLSFGALYAFAVMHDRSATTDDRRPTTEFSVPKPHPLTPNAHAWFAGLLAGVAAGQLALTRIDFFVLVAPLLVYLGYIALAKRWTRVHSALAAGLGAMLVHAALHIVFISRAYFLDTLYARLQDQSAIVAQIAYWLWTPALRQQFLDIPRSAPLRAPYRLPLELALVVALVVAFVLLRRDGRPQAWFERVMLRYRSGLLWLSTALILLLGVYGYLIRPQILTAPRLAAIPSCLLPGPARSGPDCLALQGYVGAPIATPAHPNVVAYALSIAPKLLRSARLPAATGQVVIANSTDLREAPADGGMIGHAAAGEKVQLLGRDSGNLAYLIRNGRGTSGWVITPTVALDLSVAKALPIQADNVISRLINPRLATTFSFGNPGESEKIGLAQANLVRVGWYLSPLGVVLGIVGFALWWWRGLNRASWLFLAASLISTIFFVRLSYGASDLTYIYILRRYMPLTYPALSLGMAYAIVRIADCRLQIACRARLLPFVFRLSSFACAGVLIVFFVVTNRQLYRHVEYAGALDQLQAIAQRFKPGDVLLFRGEARDTPDLVATPLRFAFGLDTFGIRSTDPGKYAADLAHYVEHWREQGRQVYLVLGANGAVELPGLRPVRVGPMTLRLPEFQQLRDQKPSLPQEFAFDFMTYRLEPASGAPEATRAIAADDYVAQVRGFYHTEQIDRASVAWTDGDALLRLRWPSDNAPLNLTIDLSPGAARPAQLGPAHVCLSYRPETTLALADAPFAGEQCFDLAGSALAGYHYTIDPRGVPAPATGTFLLRISSPTWSPAALDPSQHDPRQLGVLFGGVQ